MVTFLVTVGNGISGPIFLNSHGFSELGGDSVARLGIATWRALARQTRRACQGRGDPAISRPPNGTERGRSSGVEHNLAKVGVEGSNPFARSRYSLDVVGDSAVRSGTERTGCGMARG